MILSPIFLSYYLTRLLCQEDDFNIGKQDGIMNKSNLMMHKTNHQEPGF
jgi:hypothetical protein